MGLLAQRQAYATGLLQKQDPLPPGRYWIDVFGDKVQLFDQWLNVNSTFVAVEQSEGVAASGDWPEGEWVLFRVHDVPVPWGMQTKLGWPTIADKNVKQKSDTAQRPPEQSPSDFWFGSEGKFPWAPYAIFAGLLVGIVAMVRK